jgi:hypothetical protein
MLRNDQPPSSLAAGFIGTFKRYPRSSLARCRDPAARDKGAGSTQPMLQHSRARHGAELLQSSRLRSRVASPAAYQDPQGYKQWPNREGGAGDATRASQPVKPLFRPELDRPCQQLPSHKNRPTSLA